MTRTEESSPDPGGDHSTTTAPGGAMPPSVQVGTLSAAIFRVARLHRMLAGQLLRQVGLHPGQELVMMQLWDAGPQRQVDLVRLLGSDAATMTRAVQRLERAGFVRRDPDPHDRRASTISASTASFGVREQVDRIWADLENSTRGVVHGQGPDTTQGLDEAAVADLASALEQVARHLTRALEAGRDG